MPDLFSLDQLNAQGEGMLPGLIGIRFTHAERGLLRSGGAGEEDRHGAMLMLPRKKLVGS